MSLLQPPYVLSASAGTQPPTAVLFGDISAQDKRINIALQSNFTINLVMDDEQRVLHRFWQSLHRSIQVLADELIKQPTRFAFLMAQIVNQLHFMLGWGWESVSQECRHFQVEHDLRLCKFFLGNQPLVVKRLEFVDRSHGESPINIDSFIVVPNVGGTRG